MKSSNPQWKSQLADRVPDHLTAELDVFEHEIALKKQGKIEDRVFAETRLRRGAYGQRYDNGQRSDGTTTRTLNYPSANTKGPNTLWDAPGMQRIKIPFGGLNATQLEMLADLCEEYSDGIAHITTRQDVQLHFIHIEDTPALMRRLASVGITTREACGNSVRNVTACPIAGVCREQTFDVTPYAKAITYFMLGHPDAQAFGRKFKIASMRRHPMPARRVACVSRHILHPLVVLLHLIEQARSDAVPGVRTHVDIGRVHGLEAAWRHDHRRPMHFGGRVVVARGDLFHHVIVSLRQIDPASPAFHRIAAPPEQREDRLGWPRQNPLVHPNSPAATEEDPHDQKHETHDKSP